MSKPRIVFIVDDDFEDREILKEIITSLDHELIIWESINGEDALLKLRIEESCLPDVIFLDLNMPKKNGLEFLRTIKAMDKTSHIPVHIYSTSSRESDIRETTKAGVAGFIIKTSDLKQLELRLQVILYDVFSVAH